MKRVSVALAVLGLVFTAPATAQSPVSASQTRFDAAVSEAKAAMLTDPRQAIAIANRAEQLARTISDERSRAVAMATTLWLRAEASFRVDDVASASILIERAYALADARDRDGRLEADILLTRGSVNGKQVQVARALEDFQRAHRLFRIYGDRRHEAISLICIGLLYFDAKDYETTLRYLSESIDAYPADQQLAVSVNNARGNALQDLGRFSEADAAFRQALHAARALNGAGLESTIYRNMARNQLTAGSVMSAERWIAAAKSTSGGGDEQRQLDALAAQAALQHGRATDAARLIDRVFDGVDPATTDASFRYAHLTAVSAYRAVGRPDRALAHLEALKRLDDQATKLATETSTALMAAKFNSANQDAKIARLRDAERLRVARDALQRARTERTLFLIGGGAALAIMAMLAVALLTIRRSRDQVRAANDDLAVTNGALGKALAAKTEFLATTSHEIRTPLNGILGMTQVMLADRAVSGPTRERLTVVHGAGMTMRALVDDILDVAKMETGNLGLDVAPFDPAACLRDASAIWVEQARAKALTFTLDLDRCPATVEGDAARVRQIVFNLLSNALKFTAAGSVTLTGEAIADGLRIVVRDTGVGIAADKQAEVFESFRQADTSTTRQFGGTGLGLAICRNLVEAMGGAIELDSAAGAGATFTVTLPLPVVDAAPATTAAAVVTAPGVLVVDRNPIARAMLRTLLAPHAAGVAFASSIEEVRAAGPATRVLIDGVTAKTDGDAPGFVAAVLAVLPDAAVTLLWPADDEPGRQAVVPLGLAHLLVKPVTGAALVATMFSPASDETATPRLVSEAA